MMPKILKRNKIYQSKWIDLYLDRVRFPGGRIVEKHHYIHFHKGGVAAIVENERREILLIRSYRYILNRLEWEIPAGRLEEKESILQTAKREVLEETGYVTRGHRLIYTYYPLNSMSNVTAHIVQCKVVSKRGTGDENEVQSIKWLSPAAIRKLIQTRRIRDGFTLTSLLLYFLKL